VSSIEFAEHAALTLDADARDVGKDAPAVVAARARVTRVGVLANDVPMFWKTAGHE
jgi:hypothetical protein